MYLMQVQSKHNVVTRTDFLGFWSLTGIICQNHEVYDGDLRARS